MDEGIMYLLIRLLSKTVITTFFRRVTVLGKERIPLYGPVIFVGNHMNQFVDAAMLISLLPRQMKFLVADVSLKRPIIGPLAKSAGCIAVQRPQDLKFRGIGLVYWDDEDSIILRGFNTKFKMDLKTKDMLTIEGLKVTFKIDEIIDDNLIKLDQPVGEVYSDIKGEKRQFTIIPKIDQSVVYESVSNVLKNGHAIGLFPEGGSHDQTKLLPLKPGVAVMALTSVLEGAEDVLIVPVGLNYYNPEKALSTAVVEIGKPIQINLEMAKKYEDNPRETVQDLLSTIEKGMKSVFVSAKNCNILTCIKLCVQLYPPDRTYLSQDNYYHLYQLFSQLFWSLNDDEELNKFCDELMHYYDLINQYGVADKEIWQLKQSSGYALRLIFVRTIYIIFSLIFGGILFPFWAPIRYIPSFLAERHRKKALANSKVKIRATDVVASYRIIVIIAMLPITTLIYSFILALWTMWKLGITNNYTLSLFIWFSLWTISIPTLFYLSRRLFERILPLSRNIRTLILVVLSNINYLRGTERNLVHSRINLQLKVRKIVVDKGNSVSSSFIQQFDTVVPSTVLDADNKRITSSLGEYVPVFIRAKYDATEEIL